MLGNLFEDEEDGVYGPHLPTVTGDGASSSHVLRKRPAELHPRADSGFVGLQNQGMTCYLNSLLQTMFMTPELRAGLYQLTEEDLGIDFRKGKGSAAGRGKSVKEQKEQPLIENQTVGMKRSESLEVNLESEQEMADNFNVETPEYTEVQAVGQSVGLASGLSAMSQDEEMLLSMGFSLNAVRKALRKHPSNTAAAVEYILQDSLLSSDDDGRKVGPDYLGEEIPPLEPVDSGGDSVEATSEQVEAAEPTSQSSLLGPEPDGREPYSLVENDPHASTIGKNPCFANGSVDDIEGPEAGEVSGAANNWDEIQLAPLLSEGWAAEQPSLPSALAGSEEPASGIAAPGIKKKKPRRRGLAELQKLFVWLQAVDTKALPTEDLTKSFGWDGEESRHQHDVHELNRLLFEGIEQSLKGTPQETLIEELYHGKMVNQVVCCKCGKVSEREENFSDIPVIVQGFASLEESLAAAAQAETLADTNQYFCEECDCKVDAQRSTRIRKLPQVLTLPLCRFEYDWTVGERRKISSHFSFPLAIDMAPYMADTFMTLPRAQPPLGGGITSPNAETSGVSQSEEPHSAPHPEDSSVQQPQELQGSWMRESDSGPDSLLSVNEGGALAVAARHGSAKNQVYDLLSVVIHSGSAHSGHYHAYIRDLFHSRMPVKVKEEPAKSQQAPEGPIATTPDAVPSEIAAPEVNGWGRAPGCEWPSTNESVATSGVGTSPGLPHSGGFAELEKKIVCESLGEVAEQEAESQLWYDFNDSNVAPLSWSAIRKQFGGSGECAYMLIYRARHSKLSLSKDGSTASHSPSCHSDALPCLLSSRGVGPEEPFADWISEQRLQTMDSPDVEGTVHGGKNVYDVEGRPVGRRWKAGAVAPAEGALPDDSACGSPLQFKVRTPLAELVTMPKHLIELVEATNEDIVKERQLREMQALEEAERAEQEAAASRLRLVVYLPADCQVDDNGWLGCNCDDPAGSGRILVVDKRHTVGQLTSLLCQRYGARDQVPPRERTVLYVIGPPEEVPLDGIVHSGGSKGGQGVSLLTSENIKSYVQALQGSKQPQLTLTPCSDESVMGAESDGSADRRLNEVEEISPVATRDMKLSTCSIGESYEGGSAWDSEPAGPKLEDGLQAERGNEVVSSTSAREFSPSKSSEDPALGAILCTPPRSFDWESSSISARGESESAAEASTEEGSSSVTGFRRTVAESSPETWLTCAESLENLEERGEQAESGVTEALESLPAGQEDKNEDSSKSPESAQHREVASEHEADSSSSYVEALASPLSDKDPCPVEGSDPAEDSGTATVSSRLDSGGSVGGEEEAFVSVRISGDLESPVVISEAEARDSEPGDFVDSSSEADKRGGAVSIAGGERAAPEAAATLAREPIARWRCRIMGWIPSFRSAVKLAEAGLVEGGGILPWDREQWGPLPCSVERVKGGVIETGSGNPSNVMIAGYPGYGFPYEAEGETMKVFVRDEIGIGSKEKLYSLDVSPNMTILELKRLALQRRISDGIIQDNSVVLRRTSAGGVAGVFNNEELSLKAAGIAPHQLVVLENGFVQSTNLNLVVNVLNLYNTLVTERAPMQVPRTATVGECRARLCAALAGPMNANITPPHLRRSTISGTLGEVLSRDDVTLQALGILDGELLWLVEKPPPSANEITLVICRYWLPHESSSPTTLARSLAFSTPHAQPLPCANGLSRPNGVTNGTDPTDPIDIGEMAKRMASALTSALAGQGPSHPPSRMPSLASALSDYEIEPSQPRPVPSSLPPKGMHGLEDPQDVQALLAAVALSLDHQDEESAPSDQSGKEDTSGASGVSVIIHSQRKSSPLGWSATTTAAAAAPTQASTPGAPFNSGEGTPLLEERRRSGFEAGTPKWPALGEQTGAAFRAGAAMEEGMVLVNDLPEDTVVLEPGLTNVCRVLVGELQVSKEATIGGLKKLILQMPSFTGRAATTTASHKGWQPQNAASLLPLNALRIREIVKSKGGREHIGRAFHEDGRQLSKYHIGHRRMLAVRVLPPHERPLMLAPLPAGPPPQPRSPLQEIDVTNIRGPLQDINVAHLPLPDSLTETTEKAEILGAAERDTEPTYTLAHQSSGKASSGEGDREGSGWEGDVEDISHGASLGAGLQGLGIGIEHNNNNPSAPSSASKRPTRRPANAALRKVAGRARGQKPITTNTILLVLHRRVAHPSTQKPKLESTQTPPLFHPSSTSAPDPTDILAQGLIDPGESRSSLVTTPVGSPVRLVSPADLSDLQSTLPLLNSRGLTPSCPPPALTLPFPTAAVVPSSPGDPSLPTTSPMLSSVKPQFSIPMPVPSPLPSIASPTWQPQRPVTPSEMAVLATIHFVNQQREAEEQFARERAAAIAELRTAPTPPATQPATQSPDPLVPAPDSQLLLPPAKKMQDHLDDLAGIPAELRRPGTAELNLLLTPATETGGQTPDFLPTQEQVLSTRGLLPLPERLSPAVSCMADTVSSGLQGDSLPFVSQASARYGSGLSTSGGVSCVPPLPPPLPPRRSPLGKHGRAQIMAFTSPVEVLFDIGKDTCDADTLNKFLSAHYGIPVSRLKVTKLDQTTGQWKLLPGTPTPVEIKSQDISNSAAGVSQSQEAPTDSPEVDRNVPVIDLPSSLSMGGSTCGDSSRRVSSISVQTDASVEEMRGRAGECTPVSGGEVSSVVENMSDLAASERLASILSNPPGSTITNSGGPEANENAPALQLLMGAANIRGKPFLLKDGDVIVVTDLADGLETEENIAGAAGAIGGLAKGSHVTEWPGTSATRWTRPEGVVAQNVASMERQKRRRPEATLKIQMMDESEED